VKLKLGILYLLLVVLSSQFVAVDVVVVDALGIEPINKFSGWELPLTVS